MNENFPFPFVNTQQFNYRIRPLSVLFVFMCTCAPVCILYICVQTCVCVCAPQINRARLVFMINLCHLNLAHNEDHVTHDGDGMT